MSRPLKGKEENMKTIYETAMNFACEQQTTILRLDIQFNYKTQAHKGFLKLANGNEYTIDDEGWEIIIK